MRIRKSDTVVVLSGKDKGKRGTVLAVSHSKRQVKVQGVAIAVHHARARRQGEVSQIKRVESWIDASNVMLFDAQSNRPCRVRFATVDGVKKRLSVVSGDPV